MATKKSSNAWFKKHSYFRFSASSGTKANVVFFALAMVDLPRMSPDFSNCVSSSQDCCIHGIVIMVARVCLAPLPFCSSQEPLIIKCLNFMYNLLPEIWLIAFWLWEISCESHFQNFHRRLSCSGREAVTAMPHSTDSGCAARDNLTSAPGTLSAKTRAPHQEKVHGWAYTAPSPHHTVRYIA